MVGEERVECKTTSAKSFSLKLSELEKIQGEALRGGAEAWSMQVEFQGQLGRHRKFAVIDWETYLQLREGEEG